MVSKFPTRNSTEASHHHLSQLWFKYNLYTIPDQSRDADLEDFSWQHETQDRLL